MYYSVSEKRTTIQIVNYSHFFKIIIIVCIIHIITNKWTAVTKISKSVSKETIVKVSKVAIKPSKVTN